jgi:probable HAF family extracellular repeat protein
MRHTSLLVTALAVIGIACAMDSPTTGRPDPGGFTVNATNSLGESVGFIERTPGFPRAAHRSRGGTMTDLGTLPGGFRSSAVAIDDAGTIVGQGETAAGRFRAVRWHRGVIQDLGTLPGGGFSVASAIEGDTVFGESDVGSGALHLFRWVDGRMTDLGRLTPPAASGEPPRRPDRR